MNKHICLVFGLVLLLAVGCGTLQAPQKSPAFKAADPASPGKEIILKKSFKTEKGTNPLADHIFCADPTAVEYQGRLYVYGTNDHQEYEHNDKGGKNTYGSIKSLVVLSTDDMVNWTFHGTIEVNQVAPWIQASWAPSIVSRVEADGKTHFYLYFSNSGSGVGVITATSPLGPWSDPLGHSLVDKSTPGLGDCEAPFDPGVAIDAKGMGWMAFGGGTKNKTGSDFMPGNARLVRLGADMLSLDSPIIEIKAPYHFEANELNVFGDTLVYTYNNNWVARDRWDLPGSPVPSACSMAYMTSTTPLDPASWTYAHHYFKNPGEYGMEYSNNHTHLHKFKGKWYLFFHTLTLQKAMKEPGGYRSLCVTQIEVDEARHDLVLGKPSRSGVEAIQALDPYVRQGGATAWRTAGITFQASEEGLDLMAQGSNGSWLALKGADFAKGPRSLTIEAMGAGMISVRIDSAKGPEVCRISVDSSRMKPSTVMLPGTIGGVHDLYFVFEGEGCSLLSWQFGK